MLNFNNCQIDLTADYGGSDKKRGIIYNGRRYMLKLSDEVSERKRNSLNSSYSNSVFSEDISCRILETMGFSVQKTLLGTLDYFSHNGTFKRYPAVACENFESKDYKLIEFKVIENSLLDHKPPRIPALEDIYEILTQDNVYFSKEFGLTALSAYWDMFIADAFLGNFDRHANNWGYLINVKTGDVKLAPIYDCGSCLYPQLADDALDRIISSEDEINKRIYVFPKAALTVNGEKVLYDKLIYSLTNMDCIDALIRIYPRINFADIDNVINNTEGISQIRKTFYSRMLSERYNKILTPAYEKIISLNCVEPERHPKR